MYQMYRCSRLKKVSGYSASNNAINFGIIVPINPDQTVPFKEIGVLG